MYSTFVITLLLTELCTRCISQSILNSSIAPVSVFAPKFCADCEFAAASTAVVSISLSKSTTATRTALLFTEYSISREYSSNGLCVTTSGPSIAVSPPYSIAWPDSISASDFGLFEQIANRSFLHYLGFSPCSTPRQDVVTTTFINSPSLTSLPPSATATSTKVPIPRVSTETSVARPSHHRLDEHTKVGIGIVISVVVIALFLLAVFLSLRSYKIRKTKTLEEKHTAPEDSQPYLQQKAELEAEEIRKHELEVGEIRHELDGKSRIHEISDESGHGLPSVYERQELRGEEISRELEV